MGGEGRGVVRFSSLWEYGDVEIPSLVRVDSDTKLLIMILLHVFVHVCVCSEHRILSGLSQYWRTLDTHAHTHTHTYTHTH